jgi:hypothetical protein
MGVSVNQFLYEFDSILQVDATKSKLISLLRYFNDTTVEIRNNMQSLIKLPKKNKELILKYFREDTEASKDEHDFYKTGFKSVEQEKGLDAACTWYIKSKIGNFKFFILDMISYFSSMGIEGSYRDPDGLLYSIIPLSIIAFDGNKDKANGYYDSLFYRFYGPKVQRNVDATRYFLLWAFYKKPITADIDKVFNDWKWRHDLSCPPPFVVSYDMTEQSDIEKRYESYLECKIKYFLLESNKNIIPVRDFCITSDEEYQKYAENILIKCNWQEFANWITGAGKNQESISKITDNITTRSKLLALVNDNPSISPKSAQKILNISRSRLYQLGFKKLKEAAKPDPIYNTRSLKRKNRKRLEEQENEQEDSQN